MDGYELSFYGRKRSDLVLGIHFVLEGYPQPVGQNWIANQWLQIDVFWRHFGELPLHWEFQFYQAKSASRSSI
jgi:hypothetical protein